MTSDRSLAQQFVDLQFYLPDRPEIQIKGYTFKERLAEFERQLAQAREEQQETTNTLYRLNNLLREQGLELAQAREELRIVTQERQTARLDHTGAEGRCQTLAHHNIRLEQENAAMRALLEAFTKEEIKGFEGDAGDEHYCAACEGPPTLTSQPLEHSLERKCPWVGSRVFLAAHPAP